MCWTATITSSWFEDTSSIWEPAPDNYRYRFTFENAEDRGPVDLGAGANFSRDASLAIKRSGLVRQNGGLQCQSFPASGLLMDQGEPAIAAGQHLDTSSFHGDLNVPTNSYARAEQADLRRRLLAGTHECALCRRVLSPELLVAAHIKKRSLCNHDERRDLDNIAMAACKLGCDTAFELGIVIVDKTGITRINTASPLISLRPHFNHLDGRECGAFRDTTKEYFAWHRHHHST